MIAAFAVPLLLLVTGAGLGALSSTNKARAASQQAVLALAAEASVQAVQGLQAERAYAALAVLGVPGAGLPAALIGLSPAAAGLPQSPDQLEGLTDQALATFASAAESADKVASAPFAAVPPGAIGNARADWGTSPRQAAAELGSAHLLALENRTYGAYTTIIGELIGSDEAAALIVSDETVRSGVEALAASLSYTEAQWSAFQDLVLAAPLSGHALSLQVEQAQQDLGAARTWYQQLELLATGPYAGSVAPSVGQAPPTQAIDHGLTPSGQVGNLLSAVEALSGHAPTKSVTSAPVSSAEAEIASTLTQRATSLRQSASLEEKLMLLLDGAGIVAGLLLVLLVSRSVARPLVDLVRQAEELATTALPATVHTILEAGSETTPEVPSITVNSNDEVADMARALDAVNKTAVQLALGQAELRHNLAEAFVNLGRRNQNLVTRQLEYLSEIELKEADPDSLEELFRLDHLATRMRRNAESLLILAGSGPARQWAQGVPAMDVARAASAEVEDYKRLRLHHFDAAMVIGAVTTDLVHILAELIENSLTFSPPASTVDIYGRFLEGAYVIVIVDSGIGMSAEDLETANRRLAGEDKESKVPGRYLGHFVAGKLAERHGITISLQASHSGGVVARVKLPIDVIEEPVADLSAQAELPIGLGSTPPTVAPRHPSGKPLAAGLQELGNLSTTHLLRSEEPTAEIEASAVASPSEAPEVPPPTEHGPVEATEQAAGLSEQTATAFFRAPGAGRARLPDSAKGDAEQGATTSDVPSATSSGETSPLGPPGGQEARWDPLAARPASAPGTFWTAPKVADPIRPSSGTRPGTDHGRPRPAAPPTPDLGIMSPLAATNAIGRSAKSAGGTGAAPIGPPPAQPASGAGEGSAPASTLPASTASDNGAGGAATAAGGAWDILHSPHAEAGALPKPAHTPDPPMGLRSMPGPLPTIGPAAQARSTAEGLRKLTRRVPGAALEHEDGSLRRATPTSTARNPLGVTGALSQYLSATSNEARHNKDEEAEKEQDAQ
ncbi:MAG TPA: ATP-binding protein [Acidimicrobiales bacterium]|nr:ATP-binding protein [Acidimicrobiales bacterium]